MSATIVSNGTRTLEVFFLDADRGTAGVMEKHSDDYFTTEQVRIADLQAQGFVPVERA